MGPWIGNHMNPEPFAVHDMENLSEWSQFVRLDVINGEIMSRIGFGRAFAEAGPQVSVYHKQVPVSENADDAVIDCKHYRMIGMRRPSVEDFSAQLEHMRAYADLRGDRAGEILTQGGGYLPYFSAIAGISPGKKRWTHELLAVAQEIASRTVLQVKNGLACKRPDMYSAQIQPIIPMPGHGTLPSGHATESHLVATVFAKLLEGRSKDSADNATPHLTNMLLRVAGRISQNRTVAGVHFPVDSIAGAALGVQLGKYLVNRATDNTAVEDVIFNGEGLGAELFQPDQLQLSSGADPMDIDVTAMAGVSSNGLHNIPADNRFKSDPLEWLWNRAAAEWA